MTKPLQKIVIVGGGSAGWLTAGIIASQYVLNKDAGLELILIESPDVPTIGVGEGTWPSMRNTLKKIGVSETDFIRECDVSFKQGSKFTDWIYPGDQSYYHPFSLPEGFSEINLAEYWLQYRDSIGFAEAVSAQRFISDRDLAPKLLSTPEFSGVSNYGYHLNAGKFTEFLREHCVNKLGMTHILDHVTKVNSADSGDIASLTTTGHGDIFADLFIDCSGFSSMLLDKHYKIPFVDKREFLFNDSALAMQVPYQEEDAPVASCTISTAQKNGWIWDIGLPTRRGVGHVYSSAYTTDDDVEMALRDYLKKSIPAEEVNKFSFRKLSFRPGHRETFWHKNCVAVGMAAGFIEPLEATALVLIELSAQMISEQLPTNRDVMDSIAKRFNQTFTAHWQRIIEFLKLHYVLSKRDDSDYWKDQHRIETCPENLKEQLRLWRHKTPWKQDIRSDEMFPWASYQYILYGMGFETSSPIHQSRQNVKMMQLANNFFNENKRKTQTFVEKLPTNRGLLKKVSEFGFQKI
jgi:tryptophan halogenase